MNSSKRYGKSIAQTDPAVSIDEAGFLEAFGQPQDASTVGLSPSEAGAALTKIRSQLSVNAELWQQRVAALRLLRSLVNSLWSAALLQDSPDEEPAVDAFCRSLRCLDLPIESTLLDLRSQVVREACITVALVSQRLGMKAELFLEATLGPLMVLVNNTVKVMSNCGSVCLYFVFKTQSARFIPVVAREIVSKSPGVRKLVCELFCTVCRDWSLASTGRHRGLLLTTLTRGLDDSDSEARALARRAFCHLQSADPLAVSEVLAKLEPRLRRLLEKDVCEFTGQSPAALSVSSTNESAAAAAAVHSKPRTVNAGRPGVQPSSQSNQTKPSGRLLGQQPPQPQPQQQQQRPINNVYKGRPLVSQSQPTSRETSPHRMRSNVGSRNNCSTMNRPIGVLKQRPDSASIASRKSPKASRDSSPQRSIPARLQQQPQNTCGPKLRNFSMTDQLPVSRRRSEDNNRYNDSDETSSQVSASIGDEMDFGDPEQIVQDVAGVCQQLTGGQSRERRDGLLNLQRCLLNAVELTSHDLQRVCDALIRLLMEAQGQLMCLVLHTVQLMLRCHPDRLSNWVYVLLVRLLCRQSTAFKSTSLGLIQDTLNVLRHSFPRVLQFHAVCKFLQDSNQNPSLKTRMCALEYLGNLLAVIEESDLRTDPLSREIVLGFGKLVTWSQDSKCTLELRKKSAEIICRLHEVSSSLVEKIVENLSPSQKDAASKIVQNRRRSQNPPSLSSVADPKTLEALRVASLQTPSNQKTADLRRLGDQIKQTSIKAAIPSAEIADHRLVANSSQIPLPGNHTNRRLSDNVEPEYESEDEVSDLLMDLSNSDSPLDVRFQSLHQLSRLIVQHQVHDWSENFKSLLFLLFEIFSDRENAAELRALAVRVLHELISAEGHRLSEYVHLTVMKVLDVQSDPCKAIVVWAEQCGQQLASILEAEVLETILQPIIDQSDTDIRRAAIKMLTSLFESQSHNPETVEKIFTSLAPALIQCCNDSDSQIRKCAVFCFVEVYFRIGERTFDILHAHKIDSSKIQLIKLFIERKQTEKIEGK